MVIERNAESTRQRLLLTAFEEMYQHGYQGLRIDSIVAKTQLAKGALYHHFPNKLALGYAIVEEVIMEQVLMRWARPLEAATDPITSLQALLREYSQQPADENGGFQGCPLNNLAQEMSAIDEGFQSRLRQVMDAWIGSFADALSRAKAMGQVRANIDPNLTAVYIMSCMQGAICTAKCMQSTELLSQLADMLCDYLDSLRSHTP